MNIYEKLIDEVELSEKELRTLKEFAKSKHDFEIENLGDLEFGNYNLQSEQTDSSKFNEEFRDIIKKLTSLYYHANSLEKFVNNNRELNKNKLKELNKKLSKLEKEIKSYELLVKDSNGFVDLYTEDFTDSERGLEYNLENNVLFADNRMDLYFSEEQLLDTDNINEGLTLSVKNIIKPQKTDIRLSEQTGGALKEKLNDDYSLDNIFNDLPDESRVWSEVIYTEEPFSIKVIDPIFEGYENGALAKLVVTFDKAISINELSLNPFSEFPFQITGINTFPSSQSYKKYTNYLEELREGDDVEDILKSIPTCLDIKDRYLEKAHVYQFSTHKCKVIEIGICQKNYKLDNYNISRKDKENIDIFSEVYETDSDKQALYKRVSKQIHETIKDKYENIIDLMIEGLDRSLPGFDKTSLEQIIKKKNISEKKDYIINVCKLRYQYGLSGAGASYKEYDSSGIYISDSFQFKGNTKEVQLVTDEYNPKVDVSGTPLDYMEHRGVDKLPATSIEYYVTNLKQPGGEDWYPILPKNYDGFIEGERIFADDEYLEKYHTLDNNYFIAKPRFPFKEDNLKIYKNYQSEVTWQPTELDGESGYIKINDRWNEKTDNVFIASYEVKDSFNASIVDFASVAEPINYTNERGEPGESFENPSGDKITLSYFPFLDYGQIRNDENRVDTGSSFNPTENTYNPNYLSGYMPLDVELDGRAEFFDGGSLKVLNGIFKNCTDGTPYNYTKVYKEDGEMKSQEVTKDIDQPYFYNITNYLEKNQELLSKFDPQEYPVFEYLQKGKDIYLNESFGTENSENSGTINVYYKYLIEGISLKVIMRRNYRNDKGLTPVLYDYTLKSRKFKR